MCSLIFGNFIINNILILLGSQENSSLLSKYNHKNHHHHHHHFHPNQQQHRNSSCSNSDLSAELCEIEDPEFDDEISSPNPTKYDNKNGGKWTSSVHQTDV